MVHMTGIEPATSGLKSGALPLSYTRNSRVEDDPHTGAAERSARAKAQELGP
jgi:hypothetical protein